MRLTRHLTFAFLFLGLTSMADGVAAQSGNFANGRNLFQANCEVCHGTPPDIAGGARSGFNPTTIQRAIGGQVDEMRVLSFLTSAQINDIATFIGVTLGVFTQPTAGPSADYTGAWFNAAESGWGLSVIKGTNSNILGVIIYTYEINNTPSWYILLGGSWTGTDVFSGPLHRFSGPAYSSPWVPSQVSNTPVGSATLTFTSATAGSVNFNIGSTTINKTLTKVIF